MKSNRAGMKSLILKRSIIIAGMKTSVSLEDEFWQALKQIAAGFDMPMAKLVHRIDTRRQNGNLSSALRLFVLEHYLSRTKVKRENEGGARRGLLTDLRRRSSCRSACPLPMGQPYIAHISLWQAVFACVPVQ